MNESLKTLLELIRAKITEDFREKKETEDLFIGAFQQIKQENESEKQSLLNAYQISKIRLLKFLTEKVSDQKEEMVLQMIDDLRELERELIDREMTTKTRLKKSYSKLEGNLRNLQKTIENNIIGENGFKQIDGFLQDFFAKFLDEALQEAAKYEAYADNVQES